MARPVYLSTFYHQEETFILTFSQKRNSAFSNLSKSQVAIFAVNRIRQARRVGIIFLNQHHLISLSSFSFKIVYTFCNRITGFLNDGENAWSFFLVSRSSWLQETTTCIEIKVSLRQVKSNLVIHITIRLMCIESSRSSMVHTDTGSYTNFLSGFLCSLGNSLNHILLVIHTDSTVIRLHSGSQSSSGSRRVRYRVGCRESCGNTHSRELSKQQRCHTNASFLFSQIHFRTVHLVHSHSITDEIKYILCLLGIRHTCQQDKEQ